MVLVGAALVLGCQKKSRRATTHYTNNKQAAFESPDAMTVYAIDTKPSDDDTVERFHGHPVLGKVELTEVAQCQELANGLQEGIAAGELPPLADYFEPRHGIRVVKQGKTFDYLICKHYLQIRMLSPHRTDMSIATTPQQNEVGRTPQRIMDGYLTGAGIPFAPRMEALDSVDELTLLSINPDFSKKTTPETFYRYPVLGKIVTTAAQRAEIAKAIQEGLTTSNGLVAGCFEPRHAIRFVSQGQTFDCVICFECQGMHIMHPKVDRDILSINRVPPRKIMNRYLEEAGIPIAPSLLGEVPD
jgi:hypothetical protein